MPNGLLMTGLAVAPIAAEAEFLPFVTIDTGTILFTLINTLIIFLIFRIFLFKPVGKILDKRKEMAAESIAAAEKAKAEAEKAEKLYLDKIDNAKTEAAEIVKAATLKAQAREDQIIAEANAKAQAIKEKAEETIELDKKRAINDIKNEVSEIVILAASKVCEREISAKDNEELINSFLVQVGDK